MRLSIFVFLLAFSISNIYSQSETEKKLILLEYQIKELKEQNEKLTERVIALELQLKESKSVSKVNPSTSTNTTQTKTLPKATTGGRCTAITQAGTQCKRSAQAGRSRCWQH
jgi:hypothetical protein